jgi:hypothetical protein
MRYRSAEAFRVALETQLNQIAASGGPTTLVRLRKVVVFDRLLARLLVAAPDRWVVKGGVALEFRYHVQARIAGRRFENIVLDIGFGTPLPVGPDRLRGPNLLAFAGFEPILVPCLPIELHLAEKLHAYTRTYRTGQVSTRVKDLIDLLLIRENVSVEADQLRRAIITSFVERGTHDLPAFLPAPPSGWGVRYPILAQEVGLDSSLEHGYRLAAEFLDPVLGGSIGDARWDPKRGEWRLGEDR